MCYNNTMMKYQLIKATTEYIIINKPTGLLSHGAPHIKEPALTDLVLKDYPEIKKVGDDPWRPGIVHRLDKDVSGLIIFARTQNSFDNLKDQFQKRKIRKQYTALVYGRIIADEDEINFPLKRSKDGYKMVALPVTDKGEINTAGRQAITFFQVSKKFINYTLINVEIKTGRTHQIRCHLSAYGYPLLGDDIYGNRKTKAKNKKINLGRIFLVAHQLEFADMKGGRQLYSIDLPKELIKILEIIK